MLTEVCPPVGHAYAKLCGVYAMPVPVGHAYANYAVYMQYLYKVYLASLKTW